MCGCCCLSEFFQTLINSFRSILWRLLCICRAQWSAEDCPWTPYVCKISLLCWLDLCVGLGTCLKFRSVFCQVLLGLFCRSAQHPGQLGMCTQLAYSRVFPAHVHRPPDQHGSMGHPFINSLSLISHFQDLLIKFLISWVIYCIPRGTATQRNRAMGCQHSFSTDFDALTIQLGMSFPSSSPKFQGRAVELLVFISSASLEVLLHLPSWC